MLFPFACYCRMSERNKRMLKPTNAKNNVYAVWHETEDWIVLAAAASKQEARDHAIPVIAKLMELPENRIQSHVKIELERVNGRPLTAGYRGVAVTSDEFVMLGVAPE